MTVFRKSPNPAQMTLGEVADAIGLSAYTVRMSRKNPESHPFFRKSFKTGTGPNSPMRWWRSDVDAYLREISGRGLPSPDPDAPPPVASLIDATAQLEPDLSGVMSALADLAEGIAGVLLDVAAKARSGEYN